MILARLVDLIFPKRCFGCKQSGSYLCRKCRCELSKLRAVLTCPSCRKRQLQGRFCSKHCREKFSFDELIYFAEYKNNLLKKLIIKFKYGFIKELSGILGEILAECLQGQFNNCIITFVPASKSRQNYRGFNQAFLLAEELSSRTGIVSCECLIRKGNLKQQASLSKMQRIENARGSVGLKIGCEEFLADKKMILVDDIATTCQTLNECSKVLRAAGVKYICALTLARKW